jgi:hypothetical protein
VRLSAQQLGTWQLALAISLQHPVPEPNCRRQEGGGRVLIAKC